MSKQTSPVTLLTVVHYRHLKTTSRSSIPDACSNIKRNRSIRYCFRMDLCVSLLLSISAESGRSATDSLRSTRTFLARFGLIDGQGSPVEILFIECVDGLSRFAMIRHLHEPESAGTASGSIDDDRCRLDLPILREQFRQFCIAGVVREVAYIDVHCFRLRHEKS